MCHQTLWPQTTSQGQTDADGHYLAAEVGLQDPGMQEQHIHQD